MDQKFHKDIEFYYIRYITFYLINPSTTGYFEEKNGKKYLIVDQTEKYEEVFSGIRSKFKTINGGKELFYEKNLCYN